MLAIDKEFKKNFLNIINDPKKKYQDNEAAMFLIEVVEAYAGKEHFEESVIILSEKPNYGSNGEIGGINVDHQKGVSYTLTGDATWVTLDTLVADIYAGGGIPDWWDDEWTTGLTDDELAAEIEDEALNKQAKRRRFMEYGTGDPIESIEFSYDNDFMYKKCGRLTERAELTPSLKNHLDTLSPSDVMEAAHIFGVAENGG